MAERDLVPESSEGVGFGLGGGHFNGCGENGLEQEPSWAMLQIG